MSKIVYVEDNPLNMRVIEKMLSLHGYDLIWAKDGFSGIETVERELPEVILMDISLPDISGLEAVERIKTNPDVANIPIVALTADTSSNTYRQCIEAGCSAYLNKPVTRVELLQTIQSVVNSGAA